MQRSRGQRVWCGGKAEVRLEVGGGQGTGPSQTRLRAGVCFPLEWHGRSRSEGGAELALCGRQLYGQSLRWLSSPRESREGLEPRLEVRVRQLLSEEVMSEVGLEGQMEDLAMTRKAEGWGLLSKGAKSFEIGPLESVEGGLEGERDWGSESLTSRKSSLNSQTGPCATSLLGHFLTITLGREHW